MSGLSYDRLGDASREMLAEMIHENPFADDRWQNFDPPFPRSVVSALERRGWIQTRDEGRHAEHRFTERGQSEWLCRLLESRGYKITRPRTPPNRPESDQPEDSRS